MDNNKKKKKKKKKWVVVNYPLKKRKRNSNYIRTAKYTVLTFIPLNLFEQLKKLSNLYFLVILGFSLIPGISPVFPFALITPPIFLIGSSMLKDMLDDLGRLSSDLKANGRKVKVTSREFHRRFTHMEKSNINPGDYVEVRRNEEIPCDMVILFSSREKGSFFVETSNLDGETNLKRKNAVFEEELSTIPKMEKRAIRQLLRKKEDSVDLVLEKNTKDLDQFDGRMKITYQDDNNNNNEVTETKEYVLSFENFVCGGCVMKEAEKIQGFACFTGKNTKMFKNLRRKRSKWGSMDRKINCLLLIIIFFQEVLIFILIIISYILESSPSTSSFSFLEGMLGSNAMLRNHWYLEPIFVQDDSLLGFWKFISKYMTFFILFGYFIPMSVFVTFTIILSIQTKMIERRIQHEGVHMNARSSNLNPDLAGVDIIITDKTGTLTENKMVFAECFTSKNYFSFSSATTKIIRQEEMDEEAYFFLLCLATNNSVTVRTFDSSYDNDDDEATEISYSGESTDEVALVRDLLCNSPIRLIERRKNHVTVEFEEEEEVEVVDFEILEVFQFTSSRKRMSIIVRDPRTEETYLFIKGGDSELLKRSSVNKMEEYHDAVMRFSRNGYRTLVVGYKRLDPETIDPFLEKFREVRLGVSEDREDLLERMMDEMEDGIVLTGVTAIEDRLQDGVREVVQFFRAAGVKFIVMTGDQMETAIQTSLSAGILHNNHSIITTAASSKNSSSSEDDDTEVSLEVSEMENESVLHKLYFQKRKDGTEDEDVNLGGLAAEMLDSVIQDSRREEYRGKIQELVINQDVLAEIMKKRKVLKRLFVMIRTCRAVVFSRVTPLQKSDMTKKIQKKLFKRCLAIGDGANDVSMIQNANIGVGIKGREGSQAARASDFALPNFKSLLDLLAVEGRWSYFRCSSCLLISLFKNYPITFIQLLYLPFNGFSSQMLIDSWILTLFNLIFLALPPAWMGTFDRDLSSSVLKKSPELYENVRKDRYSGCCQIITMYIQSTFLSMILFYVLYGILSNKEGIDIVQTGFVLSTTSLVLMFFQIMVSTKTWDCFIILLNVISIASYVFFCLFYTSLRSFWGIRNFYFVVFELLPLLEFYVWIGLIVGIWVLIVFCMKWVGFKFCPTKVEKARLRDSEKKCYSCCCCCKKEECAVCAMM